VDEMDFQNPLRVSFQGEPGAYSEAAVVEHFDQDAVLPVPCETFELVFAAVSQSSCDYGFIPIENSLAGSIHQNYDLLLRNNLWVVGEHFLRVKHCLIARPGAQLFEIKKVISHPQALAQCEAYLRSHPSFKVEPVYDTAGSVKIARDQDDPTVAAIASYRAAQIYGMQILAEGIEDNPANFTRFLVISRQPVHPENTAKTSVVFSLKNQPGSLFRALSVFALRDIDLTKIESRPLVGKPWEYYFYVDFIGSTDDPVVSRALAHLSEYAPMLRNLGSYPCYAEK
jgi:prephenate dehydratase